MSSFSARKQGPGPKKCKYCSKMIKNKDYLPHMSEEHDDEKARQIIEELKDLGQ